MVAHARILQRKPEKLNVGCAASRTTAGPRAGAEAACQPGSPTSISRSRNRCRCRRNCTPSCAQARPKPLTSRLPRDRAADRSGRRPAARRRDHARSMSPNRRSNTPAPARLAPRVADALFLVMRVYFEKAADPPGLEGTHLRSGSRRPRQHPQGLVRGAPLLDRGAARRPGSVGNSTW
jgi:hypothetical protein